MVETYNQIRATARRQFLGIHDENLKANVKIVRAFNAGFDAAADLANEGVSQIYGEIKHPYDPEKKR